MTPICHEHETKIRVLVVEDRENWRTTFCELLDDLGYEPVQATCGEQFIEMAPKADVIVLDISMPMMPGDRESKTTGLEVLLRLQSDYPGHVGIQHPIVRSMWEREDFRGTLYERTKVDNDHWVSRNMPSVCLLDLITQAERRLSERRN